MVEGVRWKTYSSFDDLGDFRDHLHGGGAGADDADALALRVDVVVPARGVERLALEGLHALDAGELRRRQDAVGEHDEARPHGVAAVRGDGPAAAGLVPLGLLDGRVEQAAVVEAGSLAMAWQYSRISKPDANFIVGIVAHLLEQRQIAVALDVAGDAGIAVPVPGAADVAALLAEAHIGEAGLAQLVPEQQRRRSRRRSPGSRNRRSAPRARPAAPNRRRRDTWRTRLPSPCSRRRPRRASLNARYLRLLLGIEHGARRRRRQRLQRLVGDGGIALAGDPLGRLGGAGIEDLQAVVASVRIGCVMSRVPSSSGRIVESVMLAGQG